MRHRSPVADPLRIGVFLNRVAGKSVAQDGDDVEGGLIRIHPETLEVTRYQREDVYSNLGESTVIDDDMYFVETDRIRLKRIDTVTAYE
jgi:hypothetical protein